VPAARQLQARPRNQILTHLLSPSPRHQLTRLVRRWEQQAQAQAQAVEAALSNVRSMQNDMSNLSLDALVTLKHDLSGGGGG
jgi:hypothetical protein